MKKIFLFILIISFAPLMAQETQWAFKVLDYSTQKSSNEFNAKQVLGKPNALQSDFESPFAWQPKDHSSEQFIKVGFMNPIRPKQIIIVESFNPGFLSAIYVYDADGKEYQMASFEPKARSTSNRILNLNYGLDMYVFAVKLVFKPLKNTPIQIDAIGITSSAMPFKLVTKPNDLIKASMVAQKLDTNINSKYPEMGPLISPDGKTLYFSRANSPLNTGGEKDLEDIYYSIWNEDTKKWGVGKNLGDPLNTKDPNFINSISPDGNTILVGNSYMPDGTMRGGVSTSRRTNNGWEEPKSLNIEDNDYNTGKLASYFQSNSQKILLISYDREGDSYGTKDLYVSFLKDDSIWSKPINLGKNINTKGIEQAPFLASDDKTLYFASDGWGGYGGSDIYMSRRLDDSWQRWSEPENLGPIVNTPNDESYFTVDASGTKVFFTSQVDDNDVDIYKLELPKILKPLPVMLMVGNVINSKTKELVPNVKIFFENLTSGKSVGVSTSNPYWGNFQIVLPAGSKYGYFAEKTGYISVNSNIDLTKMTEFKEIHQDIYITPLEVGQTVILHNIFFDFDKFSLKKASFLELDRLAGLLRKNKNLVIEISAFTDNIGTDAYNDWLSVNRAAAVTKYLTSTFGSDMSRIKSKFNGEKSPIATNNTAKGRKLNRRIQFKVLEN